MKSASISIFDFEFGALQVVSIALVLHWCDSLLVCVLNSLWRGDGKYKLWNVFDVFFAMELDF